MNSILEQLNRTQLLGLGALAFLTLRERSSLAYQYKEWNFTDIPSEIIGGCEFSTDEEFLELAEAMAKLLRRHRQSTQRTIPNSSRTMNTYWAQRAADSFAGDPLPFVSSAVNNALRTLTIMPKCTTYYTQTERIDQLVDRFGSHLEELTRTEKLALRATLTYYLFHLEVADLGEYTLSNAANDTLLGYCTEDHPNLLEAFTILDSISEDETEGLIEAITAQCRWGNARHTSNKGVAA